jgi:hypothetical protein
MSANPPQSIQDPELRLIPSDVKDRRMLETHRSEWVPSMPAIEPQKIVPPRANKPIKSELIFSLELSCSKLMAFLMDPCSRLPFNQPLAEYKTGSVPCKCCKINWRFPAPFSTNFGSHGLHNAWTIVPGKSCRLNFSLQSPGHVILWRHINQRHQRARKTLIESLHINFDQLLSVSLIRHHQHCV